jgi:hypothetical protein
MSQTIGFDRDIKLEWLDAVATQVAAGRSTQEVRKVIHKMLGGVLSSGKPGAAMTKTTTVLLHVWSQVPENATGLRDRIATVVPELSPQERLAAHWSMCISTYPFFLDVAANIGRLIGLQGEVSIASLRRRLAERWGDRSLMPQATRKVVRSMVAWGVLQDLKPGLYVGRDRPFHVGVRAGTFFAEALLVGTGQKAMAVLDIERHPALFPFGTGVSVSILRAAKQFSVHRQGVDMEIVELATKWDARHSPASK